MADARDDLMLKHLIAIREDMRGLREDVRELRAEVRDLSRRVSTMEQQLAATAGTNGRIDALAERVDRIERRLELRDDG